MLKITIRMKESFDSEANKFIPGETFELQLEHSLVSLSKWESKFEKPFLGLVEKTTEELLWYIGAMDLTDTATTEALLKLNQENISAIDEYINAKMTATWFRESKASTNREIVTAELIYYWMLSMNIPFECQHWHLNRLLTLIRVVNEKNAPAKKLSKSELAAQNRQLNEERRAAWNTKG